VRPPQLAALICRNISFTSVTRSGFCRRPRYSFSTTSWRIAISSALMGSLRRRRREGLPQSGARLRRYVSVLKIVAYKPRSKSALDSYTAILPHLRVCSFTRFNLDFVSFSR
jgi:hypothetical protein